MTSDAVFRSIISASVEKALLEMGTLELDLVVSKLKEDYSSEISDCLDHPEYLKQILCELYGNSHDIIIKSIHESIERTNMEKPLMDFLTVIECRC